MKRVMLLTCSVAAIAAWQARADDLTISTATSTAVKTSTAANNAPGNITITASGSVTGNITGPAVTLDGNNTFVINNGNITNTSGINAVGVNILSVVTGGGNVTGNLAGGFTNGGTITIPATGSPFTSTGQFGVLLNGNGTFTGNLTTLAGSTVTVSGVNPVAFAVESPVIGNVTLGGTEKAIGQAATGVAITQSVSGSFANTGTISTAPEGNSTAVLNSSPSNALAIGSSVSGGVLNSATGHITTLGSAAAVIISPAVGTNPASMVLGNVSDLGAPGNSFLNRGTIAATENQPGVSALALQIGAAVGVGSGQSLMFNGGFYNSGSITASSTSDNGNATSVSPTASAATSIVFGNGTNIGNFTNTASGTISATTGGPLGGTATAITVQSGGNLTLGNTSNSFTNDGTITAQAVATDSTALTLSAFAIQDKSGTIANITNSGTISATASTLQNGTQVAVAADLSARTGQTKFKDTGIVIGDILFGSASGNQSNSLMIEGPNASITGRVHAIGAVDVSVSGNTTGGTLTTNSASGLGTLTVGQNGTLNLELGQNTTIVSANGNATFDPASHLVLTPVALLPSTGNITLIHSNSSLTIDDFAGTTATATVPFLYTGNVTQTDSKTLKLQYALKTPAALGLTGSEAVIFQPAVAAAIQDPQLSAAFGTLNTSAAVQAATQQLLPTASAAPRVMAETFTDSSTSAVGSRQRMLLMNGSPEADSAVWGEGFYNLLKDNGSDGYDAHAKGGVLGVDYSVAQKGHVGGALTVFEGTTTANAPQTSRTDVQWIDASIYMGLRSDNLFFEGAFNVGGAKLSGKRDVTIGNVSRTAVTNGSTAFLISQSVTGGYIYDLGRWKIAPEASLDALFLNDSAYHEIDGGNGVDLSIRARSENSLRAFLGVAATSTYEIDTFRLVPQFLAGYSYDFLAHGSSIEGTFTSVPGSVFSISGPPLESSKFIGAANVNLSLDHWSLGLVYDISGASNALAHTAGATLVGRF